MAVAIILVLSVLHYRSMEGGSLLQVIVIAAKVIPFVIVIVVRLINFRLENFKAVSYVAGSGAYNPFAGLLAGMSPT